MVPFRFVSAADEDAALNATAGRFLAGGTTLVDLMKLHVEQPTVLVDINPLPLARIEALPDGGLRVGAMVRNSDMAHHDLIRTRYPLLSQAILASIASVKRGCGLLVEHKGQTVAASRSDADKLTLRSAVCTHMGCRIPWNDAERSWDCPCHGSRFTPEGAVISGPAEDPLAPVTT